MKDTFVRFVSVGILLCLLAIAYTLTTREETPASEPYVEVNTPSNMIQLSENRIGVVDHGSGTGWEQLVIFDYNSKTKTFDVVSSLPYEQYFNNPKKYKIPIKPD